MLPVREGGSCLTEGTFLASGGLWVRCAASGSSALAVGSDGRRQDCLETAAAAASANVFTYSALLPVCFWRNSQLLVGCTGHIFHQHGGARLFSVVPVTGQDTVGTSWNTRGSTPT